MLLQGQDQFRTGLDVGIEWLWGNVKMAAGHLSTRPVRALTRSRSPRNRRPVDRAERLGLLGFLGHGQSQAVGGDDPLLPAPVAQEIAHEVLGRSRPGGVEGFDPGIEVGVTRSGAPDRRTPRQSRRAVVDQPVAHGLRGADVVLVVAGDAGDSVLVGLSSIARIR